MLRTAGTGPFPPILPPAFILGNSMANLLIFGAGYSGLAIARQAARAGMTVRVTSRGTPASDVPIIPFDGAEEAIAGATHVVSTAAPAEAGDPILARWGAALRACKAAWFGYLSTTGVYGDRQGGWVDEDTPPAPLADRARRRVAAEREWEACAAGRPLDLIRLAGIYGPGRSALDDVRGGQARRVVKPGHVFGRIHRDDIAAGVLAAIAHPPPGTRVLNFTDDEPAESAAVLAEAASLLGVAPPPEVAFEAAWAGMSAMGRSFWAESRRVANARTKAALQIAWRYPSYREGLRSILADEARAVSDLSAAGTGEELGGPSRSPQTPRRL
jgi:nucleoside-diphosphate-sugar epimerase